MSKNILFVCEYFYPNQLSSAVLPYELAQILLAEGFTVHMLTANPTGKQKNVEHLDKL